MGERFLLSTVGGLLALALEQQGRYDEAEVIVEAVEVIAAPDDIEAQAIFKGVRSRLLVVAGEHPAALEAAVEAVRLREQSDSGVLQAQALADLAGAQSANGEVEAARSTLDKAIALTSAKGDVVTTDRLMVRLRGLEDSVQTR
jgi:ATP/maltotriose-dependent transcriptional regulator MalT